METRSRSWAKSVSWRLIGIVYLAVLALVLTGSWKETGMLTVLFHGVRLVMYYAHERLWARVSWGRLKHPLSCLPVRNDLRSEDYEAIRKFMDERGYSAREPEYQI